MCRIRKRLTAHGGETFDAPTEWLNWHSSGKKESREQELAALTSPEVLRAVKEGNVRLTRFRDFS